jgi:hypothetical protein
VTRLGGRPIIKATHIARMILEAGQACLAISSTW